MATAVQAEKMAAGGDALGHLPDGRVVFVRGALPGERVMVDLVASKRDYAKAVVVDVVEPSPHRVAPPCPAVAQGCGGCGWQHIDPVEQLRLKTAIVDEALRRTGRFADPVVVPAGAVPPWAYRTTLRVAVADGSGRVGLRAGSSHRVVELDACPVAHPAIAELLGPLRVGGASEVSLRVGVAMGERSACADREGAVLSGLPADVRVGPDAVVHERVQGSLLRVSATSFFQSGPEAAELLVTAVRASCGDALDAGHLLDAYGGVGLFAATLGAPRVDLVESSPAACADAVANLGGRDIRVHCTPFEDWVPEAVPLVVADPARRGLDKLGVERIAATGAARLVLVSCDPVSLARDARLLHDHGFVMVESQVLDLFPHTPHVEVVTRFDRAERTIFATENPTVEPAP